MNKTEENRYTMYRQVLTLLEKNLPVLETIPNFKPAIEEFRVVYDNIAAADTEYGNATGGKLTDFELAEEKMTAALAEAVKYLKVVAKSAGNNELLDKVDYSPREFQRMRDSNLSVTALMIADTVAANIAVLQGYNYTAANLEKLRALVNDFTLKLNAKEESYTGKPNLKTRIKDLFAAADELLKNKIDFLADLFEETNPEFYNNYYSARVVKNLGIRHEKTENEPAKTVSEKN